MAELVQENLSKAQGKQKRWYDRNARITKFEPGDPLVLLPTSSSKLLAQWQEPYQVVRRTGKVNLPGGHARPQEEEKSVPCQHVKGVQSSPKN